MERIDDLISAETEGRCSFLGDYSALVTGCQGTNCSDLLNLNPLGEGYIYASDVVLEKLLYSNGNKIDGLDCGTLEFMDVGDNFNPCETVITLQT